MFIPTFSGQSKHRLNGNINVMNSYDNVVIYIIEITL